MKVDKAVCTTDSLDDISRVIKFEAIFSALVENKLLAIKRECEQQTQKNKKKCLLIDTLENGPVPKNQPASASSNHLRRNLFGKRIFGRKSKLKEHDDPTSLAGDSRSTDYVIDERVFRSQNPEECELNELNYHQTAVLHCLGDVELGSDVMMHGFDGDEDDITIGPENSSILLSDDITLKSDKVQIEIGHLDDGDGTGLDLDDDTEIGVQTQSCSEKYDRELGVRNKKLRVHYDDQDSCAKTKTNTSSMGGRSSKETSVYIENERTRLRILEAKSISAQCSPIFQRQKLSELPRSHVTSFDEMTKKVPQQQPHHHNHLHNSHLHHQYTVDHEPVTSSISVTADIHAAQSKLNEHQKMKATKIKITKPCVEYDSIISYNQSTATTTTTSNTLSSPGIISTFNQLASASTSSNQPLPKVTTIKTSTSSSTGSKSIKSKRHNERPPAFSAGDRTAEMGGAINKRNNNNVIDDNQSAINSKTNNNSNNSDRNSKQNNSNNSVDSINNNNNSKISKYTKNVNDTAYCDRPKNIVVDCSDESEDEFRKHRRKYRRAQRHSDPVLVFPSSTGLQHCILSRPPNQPLQLQYDEDVIYDVSLQLEPGDDAALDDIISSGRRKHRKHRHHRHGKKKRHKRRKVLIHDLDDQTVKVIDPDDLPQRARWTIIATAFLLLIMCLLLVGVTLRMAPLIDDMGKSSRYVYYLFSST